MQSFDHSSGGPSGGHQLPQAQAVAPVWSAPAPAPAPAWTTPAPGPAAPLGVRPKVPWTGVLAALAFVAAGLGTLLTWVGGNVPEVDGPVSDLVAFTGFDPGQLEDYKGIKIPGLGYAAAGLAAAGAVLAVAGVVVRRSVLFLVTSACAGVVALLAGLAIVVFALTEEVDRLPYADQIPEDVRTQIPDPDAGPGLWLYFGGAAAGAVFCSTAAVASYKGRYGVRTPAGPAGAQPVWRAPAPSWGP